MSFVVEIKALIAISWAVLFFGVLHRRLGLVFTEVFWRSDYEQRKSALSLSETRGLGPNSAETLGSQDLLGFAASCKTSRVGKAVSDSLRRYRAGEPHQCVLPG